MSLLDRRQLWEIPLKARTIDREKRGPITQALVRPCNSKVRLKRWAKSSVTVGIYSDP